MKSKYTIEMGAVSDIMIEGVRVAIWPDSEWGYYYSFDGNSREYHAYEYLDRDDYLHGKIIIRLPNGKRRTVHTVSRRAHEDWIH